MELWDEIPGAAVPLSSLAGRSRAKAGSRVLRVLAELRRHELIKQEMRHVRHDLNYGKANVTSFGVRASCFRLFVLNLLWTECWLTWTEFWRKCSWSKVGRKGIWHILTYFDMDLWPCCDLFGLPPPQVAGVAGVSRWSLTCIESTTRPGAPSRGWSRQWTKASGTSPKRWKRKKCWRTQWLDMLDVECAKICQNVPKCAKGTKQIQTTKHAKHAKVSFNILANILARILNLQINLRWSAIFLLLVRNSISCMWGSRWPAEKAIISYIKSVINNKPYII